METQKASLRDHLPTIPAAFKIGVSLSLAAQYFLGRFPILNLVSPSRPSHLLPSISVGVVSGSWLNYIDLWRRTALQEMAVNWSSVQYF